MNDVILESALIPQHPSPLPAVRRVFVIAPHPDDEILGCGGTLNLLAKQGVMIQIAIVTNGACGGIAEEANLIKQREQESIEAAKVIGVRIPSFWRLPDRSLKFSQSLVGKISDEILNHQAEIVFCPSLTENHPDHQATALATQEACLQLIREKKIFPIIFFYEVSNPLTPNLLIDITDVESTKQAAIRCFKTQLRAQPYDEQIAGLNRFRSFSLGNQCRSVEAFMCVSTSQMGVVSLFHSSLSRRLLVSAAIGSQDLPRVDVRNEVDSRDFSPSAMESLTCQSYPNLNLRGMQPDHEAEPASSGHLVLVVREPAVIAHDQVARMVGIFRNKGLYTWGQNHAVRLQGGQWEMVRADQLHRREHLRYQILPISSEGHSSSSNFWGRLRSAFGRA